MKKPALHQLGDTHRRGIGTTLALLDEAICEFDQWANGRKASSAIYEESNSLESEQKAAILRETAAVRALLAEIAQDLHLSKSTNDASRAIWAKTISLWENLAELHFKHLHRYGQPPPWLKGYLDPRVDKLLKHLEALRSIVEHEKRDGGAAG